MPKTGKRSRGEKTASTASPASRRSTRASTRAATSASSSATRQSITEPTTHGTETRDPGVPLGDLLELVQAQVRRLTELQAQQQSASAASPHQQPAPHTKVHVIIYGLHCMPKKISLLVETLKSATQPTKLTMRGPTRPHYNWYKGADGQKFESPHAWGG